MSRLATLQSVDTTREEDDDIDDNDNHNDENVVLAMSALKESQEVTMPATLEPDCEKLPVATPLMLLLLILLLQ